MPVGANDAHNIKSIFRMLLCAAIDQILCASSSTAWYQLSPALEVGRVC